MPAIGEATSFLLRILSVSGAPALNEAMLFDLRLAVTETFANIVEHSYGKEPVIAEHEKTVSMEVVLFADEIEIIFKDRGRPPMPGLLKSRSLSEYREHGLGLFLISKCMDDVNFCFGRDGVNRLRMRRKLIKPPQQQDDRVHDDRVADDAADAGASVAKHFPFHVATFEHDNSRTVCLIGTFDRTRTNPLTLSNLRAPDDRERLASLQAADHRTPQCGAAVHAAGETIILDLSGLVFIDSFGMTSLMNFCRESARIGQRVSFAKPLEKMEHLFNETGLAKFVAPEGWSKEPALFDNSENIEKGVLDAIKSRM